MIRHRKLIGSPTRDQVLRKGVVDESSQFHRKSVSSQYPMGDAIFHSQFQYVSATASPGGRVRAIMIWYY
jgi:hypothetical protein